MTDKPESRFFNSQSNSNSHGSNGSHNQTNATNANNTNNTNNTNNQNIHSQNMSTMLNIHNHNINNNNTNNNNHYSAINPHIPRLNMQIPIQMNTSDSPKDYNYQENRKLTALEIEFFGKSIAENHGRNGIYGNNNNSIANSRDQREQKDPNEKSINLVPLLRMSDEDALKEKLYPSCAILDPNFLEMERKKDICDKKNENVYVPFGNMVSLKRILIVDDSMLCQKIIIKVLDGANYSFETAGNGKEACEKIGEHLRSHLCKTCEL